MPNAAITTSQCCCLSLQWLPALIFTYINEVTGSVVSAIVVIPVFHVLGMLGVLSIDLEKGQEESAKTSHLKHLGKTEGMGGDSAKVAPEGTQIEAQKILIK